MIDAFLLAYQRKWSLFQIQVPEGGRIVANELLSTLTKIVRMVIRYIK